jgi:hypothetical protein
VKLQQWKAIARAKAGPIPRGIYERWESRIVENNWHTWGSVGAEAYLKRYGKGIGVPKLVHLAIVAGERGATLMAEAFWNKAIDMSGDAVEYPPPEIIDEPSPARREPVISVLSLRPAPPAKPKPVKKPTPVCAEVRRGPRTGM